MSDKRLLFSLTKNDFEVSVYRGSGPGGQHRNKTDTAVRVRHPASGAVASSEVHKSQEQNKRAAFRKLTEDRKFRTWLNITAGKMMGIPTPEERVEQMMQPENLRIDVKDDRGRWVECPELLTES